MQTGFVSNDFSLPSWIYCDPEFLALERERVFRPSWQVICHENDIPKPGDFQTLDFIGAMLVAIGLVILLIPAFNQITGKDLNIAIDLTIIGLAILITLVTGIFAGSYPAFYMSALQISSLFKGKLKRSVPELIARKGLVVFQFVLSICL